LVRQVLSAIEHAGAKGLSDVEADRLFGRQLVGVKRTQVFQNLRARGLIVCERSGGGGALWKSKSMVHEPRPHGRRRAGGDGQPKELRDGRWEPSDQLLRSWQCTLWPSLSIGKSIQFKNGHFCTRDPELAALLGKAHGYGTFILEDPVGIETYEADRPASVALHCR
jgi:hypothetical protein